MGYRLASLSLWQIDNINFYDKCPDCTEKLVIYGQNQHGFLRRCLNCGAEIFTDGCYPWSCRVGETAPETIEARNRKRRKLVYDPDYNLCFSRGIGAWVLNQSL